MTDRIERPSEERMAQNCALFKAANEKIREAAERYGVDARVPFVCECADTACRSIIRIPLAAYGEVRSDPRWFFAAVGHEVASQGSAVVVAEHEDYVVVEKIGGIVEEVEGGRSVAERNSEAN